MKKRKPSFGFLKKIDRNLNYRMRLFLSLFLIAPPVLLIVSIGSYLTLSRSAVNETEKSLMTIMERMKSQVELVIEETENLSRNIIYSEEVQALLQKGMEGEKYPSNTEVAYFINSFIVNREYIESVVIMGQEETLFSTEKAYTNVSGTEQIHQKWWYPYMESSEMPYEWYTQALESTKTEKPQENNIMLTRSIRSLSDYKTPVGRMMIYIKESYMKDIWESLQWGETTNLWIVNEENEVMLNNHSGEDYSYLQKQLGGFSGTGIISANGEKFLVGNAELKTDGWRLLIVTPFAEVDSRLSIVKTQILMVSLIAFLVILLAAAFTATTMARPIKLLAQVMDSYHGKLPEGEAAGIREYNTRRDEVGVIYRSYQKLTERVETLIKEIYLKDLEKKDAELALLETQINPHFLYNTLDSINWMALANDQEEISEMVTALSDTFRLSLTKNSSSFVSVGQEVQYIESYMTIQKFRYGDRLSCSYEVEEEAKTMEMLRFVLQPVVENSLKHGIDKLETGGTVQIRVYLEGDFLLLTVINDGVGIDLEKMERLSFFDVENTDYLSFDSEGYGIQNINRRIKIVHGKEYGIRYELLEGKRTACHIRLPRRPQEGV